VGGGGGVPGPTASGRSPSCKPLGGPAFAAPARSSRAVPAHPRAAEPWPSTSARSRV
jgi:hypothetical protein